MESSFQQNYQPVVNQNYSLHQNYQSHQPPPSDQTWNISQNKSSYIVSMISCGIAC
jgi:hypothetical protein